MNDATRHFAQENAHPDVSVLSGGVAIVTGGASGIGFALVEKSLRTGMNCVIADIDQSAIDRAVGQLDDLKGECGVNVIGVRTDVSLQEDVKNLGEAVASEFPDKPISLLCCNAGVGAGGSVLVGREVDWDFVMGVNLMGVLYCLREFVPKMLQQNAPGSVVTTSSQDGICAAQGVYGVSKHACVALTEALLNEVRNRLSVHVLCPNAVATNIVASERNRPERFGGGKIDTEAAIAPGRNRILDKFKEHGMPPSLCADLVFESIRTGVFYVLAESPDDEGYVRLEAEIRMNAILNGTVPYRPQSKLLSKIFS